MTDVEGSLRPGVVVSRHRSLAAADERIQRMAVPGNFAVKENL
jgi:hypothetical protein